MNGHAPDPGQAQSLSLRFELPDRSVGGEQWPEPIPPQPLGFLANVDPALEQQVLDVSQREREADLDHDHEADYLRRRVEIPERIGWFAGAGYGTTLRFTPHQL